MRFDSNQFFSGRFVFKNESKKDTITDPGFGDDYGRVRRMGEYAYLPGEEASEAGKKGIAEDKKTKEALVDAKKEVKETEDQKKKREALAANVPDKLTRQKSESLERRMITDIYGNDEELSKKYFEGVKNAIEKIPENELYDFILAHTPPAQKYEKGGHETWNKEFCALIDKHLADDLKAGDDAAKQRYIVGGMQNYLVNDFAPANVFQAGRSESMTNPFIWVDGKMGAYTMSVMAEYWNDKYGKDGKKPQLVRAGIGESLAQTKKNSEIYNNAMTILDSQLASWKGAPKAAPEGVETVVAAVVPAAQPETPAVKVAAMAVGAKAVSESKKPDEKPAEVKKSETIIKKTELKDLPKTLQEGASVLVTKGLELISGEVKTKKSDIEELKEDMLSDYDKIGEHEGDPEYTWFVNTIVRGTEYGSWPRKAFAEYSRVYKEWKDKQKELKNENDAGMLTGTDVAKIEEKISQLEKEKNEAFKNLEIAINAYIDEKTKISEELENEFKDKIYRLINEFDFPSGAEINLSELYVSHNYENDVSQLIPNMLSTQEYPNKDLYKAFYDLGEVPKRVFKNKEEFLSWMPEDKKENITQEVIKYNKDSTHGRTIDAFIFYNNLIYFENFQRFRKGIARLVGNTGFKLTTFKMSDKSEYVKRFEKEYKNRIGNVDLKTMLAKATTTKAQDQKHA